MIAVDANGVIVEDEPPDHSVSVNPVGSNRPIIKNIPPGEKNDIAFNDQPIHYKAINKVVNFPKKIAEGATNMIGNAILGEGWQNDDSFVSGDYPLEVPKGLKDNWVTYDEIPEPEDIGINPMNKEQMKKYYNMVEKKHRYNVFRNVADQNWNQLSNPKRSGWKKLGNLVRYSVNDWLSKAAYVDKSLNEIKGDPIGAFARDENLRNVGKSVVKDAVIPFIADTKYPKESQHLSNSNLKKNLNSMFDIATGNFSKNYAINTWKENHQRSEDDYVFRNPTKQGFERANLRKRIEDMTTSVATNVLDFAAKATKKDIKKAQKILQNKEEERFEEERKKKISQFYTQAAPSLMSSGGGGGGGGWYGGWRKGYRRTIFRKYGKLGKRRYYRRKGFYRNYYTKRNYLY